MYSLSTCHDKYRFYNARFIVITSRDGAYPCFTCFLHTLCDQQEPFYNAPVLGAGRESIFYLLSSYCLLKAQGLILFVTTLSVVSPHARQPCATKKFLLSGTTSVSFGRISLALPMRTALFYAFRGTLTVYGEVSKWS